MAGPAVSEICSVPRRIQFANGMMAAAAATNVHTGDTPLRLNQ
jgi:hypothetical protein